MYRLDVRGGKRISVARCLGALIGSVSLWYLSWAYAAEYPTKTIQIVNPYPPGATTDIVARILTDKLYSLLGQQVVVVNKTGGGGAIGIKAAKDAAADGYTVLVAPPPIVQIPLARKDIGFTYRDFTPINLTAKFYFAMVVKKDAPWKSLEEIIAEAKSNPGKLTWATAGTGTSHHFTLELFKILTGAELTHVPMGGETPMVTAILGGHVSTSFITLGTATPHLQAGTLRGLALTSPNRLKEFLDVPTTAEKGYPTLNSKAWVVFLVPAKTSQAIVKRLGDAFREALRDREIMGKIEKAGLTVENLGPEEAGKFLAEEHKKWSEVARVAKITPQ
jgi:tripartite-type tricarboxylate transporter receptor subunit TctC